ncbi:MAG: hypothetical protein Kow0075_16620 [Salibacteraceae bacterium]
MNTTQKIIVAGLVGAAAGAVAGVLFAPAEGKKTRKKIARSIEDLKEEVEELATKSKEAMQDLAKNGAERIKEMV